MLVENQLKHV